MRLGDVPTIDLPQLLGRYDVLLLDAYGVLMETAGALPGTAEALDTIERTGRAYLVLTNDASRLPETTARRYDGFGLSVAPERIVTSGAVLTRHFAERGWAGMTCAVLGPPDAAAYVSRAGGAVVGLDDDPALVVVADEDGFPLLEGLDELVTLLFRRVDRGDPPHLLLPNPDLVYPKGDRRFGITAGALAALLESVLAHRYPGRPDLRFTRLGKPHRPIFDEALDRIADPGARIVMVGDQLPTDIRGALAAGLDAVLVGTGLTPWDEDLDLGGVVPTYRMRTLGSPAPEGPTAALRRRA